MVARIVKLRQEVLAPKGPSRRQVVAAYRERRKAIERGQQFTEKVRALADEGRDVNSFDVVFELWLLLKELEKTL